jgi:hypothetical protein
MWIPLQVARFSRPPGRWIGRHPLAALQQFGNAAVQIFQ